MATVPSSSPTASDQMDVDSDSTAIAAQPPPSTTPTTIAAKTATKSQLPLPALQVTSSKEAEDISALIHQHLTPLLKEAQNAKSLRASLESNSLFYQSKLSEALAISNTNRNDAALDPPSSKSLVEKEKELKELMEKSASLEATVLTLRLESTELSSKLSQRDSTISNQAKEVSQLKPIVNEVNSLRMRAAERDTLLDQLSHESSRREALENAHESAQDALQEEIQELTRNLTRSRSEISKLQSERETIENESEQKLEMIDTKMNDEINKNKKLEQVIDRLKRELEGMRSAATGLEESFKKEVEHLQKMCEIHENRTKEAEQRALDCEEALKQERDLSDMRRQKEKENMKQNQLLSSGNSLAPHVKTLLSDMEKALENRWGLMEKQKIELERAKREEIRATSEKEKLQRQVKDLKLNSEHSRRDALRYSQLVDKQATEMMKMEEKINSLQQQQLQMQNAPNSGQGFGRVSAPVGFVGGMNTNSLLVTPMRGNVSEGVGGIASTPFGFSGLPPGRPSWPPSMLQHEQSQQQQQQREGGIMSTPTAMDIGPQSVIPSMSVDTFASPSQVQPNVTAHFASTLREMSEVRRRHERLLESLRENRVSLG